ncbi:MAG: hypothetical protein IPM39_12525 [Chloroflexi bacterium]|nr:hypothetical protein [Chloroflexota bacterium]
MRKRLIWLVLIFLALTLITAANVSAGTYRSPSKDTLCDAQVGSWCENGYGVQTGSSGIGACIPDQVSFIGWDLRDVGGAIDSAQLTLTTYDVSGAPSPGVIVFELFIPSTQDWTEDLDQPSPGASGTILASSSVALINGTNPQQVVFGGSADPAGATALGDYFDGLRANPATTVGVRITAGCSQGTLVAFNDRENRGNLPGGAAATEPDLILFTPTAVSLSSLNASGENANSNVPVVLVIGALGIIAVVTSFVGLPLLRQRKPQA